MVTKLRYQGIQTVFSNANKYACLFLCLCSIAEEVNNDPIDFIGAYWACLNRGFIDKDFYCANQEAILEYLTGRKWKKEIRADLPSPVPSNMYTVEKWYNRRTRLTHFKRRGFDTLEKSYTVREGKIDSYYCYIMED